ncbi:hypothetical protein OUZ56_004555 [Daphnia magna]|uniref:Uncharacterized protein n=1 Tax=Daphnia magna TaxID=35525 RepID=A0ABQ9YQ57_9CRUS|nr:hypothetical protein OUZ56_004555 [Daphnia magna]
MKNRNFGLSRLLAKYKITISGDIDYFRLLPANFRDNLQKDVMPKIGIQLSEITKFQAETLDGADVRL